MRIEIIGPAGSRLDIMEKNVHDAVGQLKLKPDIEKVTDPIGFIKRGVLRPPGLMINNELKCQGKMPTVDEIKNFLTE